jgi:cupin fold WbuC family metalloprotein
MRNETNYPLAMPAPVSNVTQINEQILSTAITCSRESPRKRIIQPLHKSGADVLQRMLNALQPGSYIRPHRHAPERGESIVVLRGSMLYITFDEEGAVRQRMELTANSSQFGVDIDGGIYHCFMALEPDTVLFEVKPGPYNASADKDFAPWAPEEGSPDAAGYMKALIDEFF